MPAYPATPHDQGFMAQALSLAKLGAYTTHPNPQVGCILVKDGQVVGRGWHCRAGEPHAEIHALSEAGANAVGATAFVTLEPCSHHGRTPPCCDALIAAGVAKVVIAQQDVNPLVAGSGIAKLREAGIDVLVGVLASEAADLNPGFALRMAAQRPLVRSKIAMSLDGRTAMASGESQWITGPEARLDVQKLRAASSVIMTGAGTVAADDCALTVRVADWSDAYLPAECQDNKVRQPLRVVVADNRALQPGLRIFQEDAPTLLASPQLKPDWLPANCRLYQLKTTDQSQKPSLSHIDFSALLAYLSADLEANTVLVEAGAGLNGALLRAGLIDELLIYIAPKLLGSVARPLALLPLDTMSQAIDLELLETCSIGADLRLRYRVLKRNG